jgi:hypothetical protein
VQGKLGSISHFDQKGRGNLVASVETLLRFAATGELALSRGTVEELGAVLVELRVEKPVTAKKRKARS